MLVLGGIGYAKSAFLKTYVYRQFIFGHQAWVIDVKCEYGLLAEALGVTPTALRRARSDSARSAGAAASNRS